MNNSMIACPECGNHIDVNEILKHQLQEEFKSKLEEDTSTEASPFSLVNKEKLEDIFANKL